MRRKIPIWVLFVSVLLIGGAGYIQDEYGTNNYQREEILLDRIDSLQNIINRFDTCYKWNNEK